MKFKNLTTYSAAFVMALVMGSAIAEDGLQTQLQTQDQTKDQLRTRLNLETVDSGMGNTGTGNSNAMQHKNQYQEEYQYRNRFKTGTVYPGTSPMDRAVQSGSTQRSVNRTSSAKPAASGGRR